MLIQIDRWLTMGLTVNILWKLWLNPEKNGKQSPKYFERLSL